jgi:hypothetical protein
MAGILCSTVGHCNALLFGLSVSIGNNVNISFYPLAQIVQSVTFNSLGSVEVMQLPAPIPSAGPITNADAEDEEPIIPELAPATGLLTPLSTTSSTAGVTLTMPTQSPQDPLEVGRVIDGLAT